MLGAKKFWSLAIRHFLCMVVTDSFIVMFDITNDFDRFARGMNTNETDSQDNKIQRNWVHIFSV